MTSNDYQKTKKGLVSKIYAKQRTASKMRNHLMPDYNLIDLRKWVFSQPNFGKLYDNWVKSNYNKWLVPSYDRLKDCNPYTLNNLRLVTWQKNRDKQAKYIRKGILKHNGLLNGGHKAVLQLDLKGKFIEEYISQSEAKRKTGIHQSNIHKVCNGLRKTAGKYIWKYKD